MRYTIRHTFNVDVDTFWDRLFFDPEYNEKLFQGYLEFKTYRVLELDRKPDGSIHRRLECAPQVEVPSVVKKIMGDSTTYFEDGRFDPQSKRFVTDARPKVGADKVTMKVTTWVEARGDKRIERLAEVESEVHVFGIGKLIDGYLEKQTRASYDAASEFTQRWIVEKGL